MTKTPWQKHASKVMKAGGSLQDASATWDKKTNKSKGTKHKGFKLKPKTKKKVKSVSTTKKSNAPKKRPKGKLERQRIKFKREFDDIARALGVPLSKTSFKIIKNSWVLKAGKVKAKNVKLSKAMANFRKRARKRI